MSQCELEFIVLDDLSVVVPTMFIDFDTIEIWPQVGLSNNQFLLQGVDRAPDDDEKASFEGVVANYLVDALGNDATQPILSVCVDVVDTSFVDGNGDDTASSLAADGSSSGAVTDTIGASRSAPVQVNGNLSGDSSGILLSRNSQDNIFDHNVRHEQNIFRKESGRLANGSGLRLLAQKADTVLFDTVVSGRYRGPKIDMEKKVSDVISGNEYQIVEELKKEQPEYFNLEGEDDQSSVLLTLQPPSSNATSISTEAPDIPVRAIESDNRNMRWRGLMGFFVLGIAMIVLLVCTANLVVRRVRGDNDSSDAFSLQSILFTPALEMDGQSTAESTVGSTTTASSLSIPTVLATDTSNEDSADGESDDSSIAIIKSILRGGEDSIVKKEAIWGVGLKTTRRRVRWALGFDESSSGSKSGSTKSESSDSGEHSGPGAYHVIPDMSGSVITSLRELFRKSEDGDSTRSTIWTAEELLDASFDGSKNEGEENEANESADSSDVEEESNSSSNSSSKTPSFAQFSVYGTALMCSQREADGMIITDKKGTAELMEEVEIATAAVIAEQLTRDNFVVRTTDEEHGDIEGAGVNQ